MFQKLEFLTKKSQKKLFEKLEFLTKFCLKKIVSKNRNFRKNFRKKTRIFDQILFKKMFV